MLYNLQSMISCMYYCTAYLGATEVVLGQFLCIKNIQHNVTAKHEPKEPKQHYSSTKEELEATCHHAYSMRESLEA